MFDSIRTIPVRVRPPYDVRIGSGLLGRCGDYLAALLGQRRIAVLADDTVASLYLDTVTAALEDAGFAVCSHIFPSGEGRKNLSTLTELLEFLASEHLTRTDCVAALGGGVTGDMAGFAAAVYLRGIRYVQLPTTLLAAVDSSVGGKTAVDLTAGKNLAGAFCQPAAVICDTDCLKTLPPDVFADGAAEAVKTGVLSDEALFALFEDGTLTADPCAALYGLTCLNDSIQDSDNNYTRFICITKDPVIYAGANRISLIIAFDNRPGALYEILSKLAALDINMTKLESCPVAGSDFEFVFFLELDASVQDPSVLAMLEEMERSCAEFQFLGNYAEV